MDTEEHTARMQKVALGHAASMCRCPRCRLEGPWLSHLHAQLAEAALGRQPNTDSEWNKHVRFGFKLAVQTAVAIIYRDKIIYKK